MSYMDDLREYEQLLGETIRAKKKYLASALMSEAAESVEYQYILNMNYTRFTFREN